MGGVYGLGDFTNPCGGQRWDMRSDGLIEVEGQGTPHYEPTDTRFAWMMQSWENWSDLILDAAAHYNLPASWILGIMSIESGLWSADPTKQAAVVSSAGARGLMQVMPATAEGLGFGADDMFQPDKAIDAGALLLSKLAKQTGGQLPQMAAIYNSGRACNDGRFSNAWNLAMADDYAGIVIKFNNSAVMYLDMSPRRGKLLAGIAIGAGGLYAAAVIAGLAALPRVLKG